MKQGRLLEMAGITVDTFIAAIIFFGSEVGKWVLATRIVLYLAELFFVNAGRRHRRFTDVESPCSGAFFVSLPTLILCIY